MGELKPLPSPICIAESDAEWPRRFQREANKLKLALGENGLRIEHVGSTAVPDLPAKPIIDILLVVADSSKENEYLPALEGVGYKLHIREPDRYEHGCS